MRRARIKAVANVPLRRKATQDVSVPLPSQPSSPRENIDKVTAEPTIDTSAISTVAEDTNSAKINVEYDKAEKTGEKPEEPITAPTNDQNENREINTLPQIPIPPSPDNTFAVLGSPPYRSESLKSDNISIKSPASPSKLLQNRSRFVRPVPRLDGSGRIRRNSIQGSGASASESEDDGRRSNSTVPNRIRNDSVCSIQSNKEPTTNVSVNNPPQSRPLPKRRMVISESARKLAEARREFLHKHGNKAPDRNKLTMYDLIYYNPVTNPMKSQDESVPRSRRESVCSINDTVEQEEENVDEPVAMPVPQVKVGPDGQLIIDEQSLVIEQTGTKKGREALANSNVVIDEGRISNGFYKRPRKSKDWPKWETLRFYTALNTIGTDFLLMQSLFPNRSRQEIKLKFKKEEKLNRPLVEKALKYHQEFDIDALEEELAVFEEREKLELEEKQRAKENKTKDKERSKTKKKRKCVFVTSSIEQGEETEDEEAEEVDDPNSEEPSKSEANNNLSSERPKKRRKRKLDVSIDEALDDLMQGAGIFSDSESETEIYEVKPTRSGRCPKTRKLQAPNVNKLDELHTDEISKEEPDQVEDTVESDIEEAEEILGPSKTEIELPEDVPEPVQPIQPTIPDMSKVEPGSLVILSSETPGEPGNTMLQVYMVSPSSDPTDIASKQNITPVDLSSELLATVTTKLSKVEPPNVDGQQSFNTV